MTRSPSDKNPKFENSGKKPLYYHDDDDFVRELIYELVRRKRYVRRESKHHIKVRDVNFWPSTGTITIDGESRHPENGSEAFLELLDKRYPKRRGKGGDTQADTVECSSPTPAPIFWMDLDDLNTAGDYDSIPPDSWDDDAP
jgi:hypothetical protein